ncbi:MAG: flagellar basal-body MS-ring/collar protein FliF [bacterium]
MNNQILQQLKQILEKLSLQQKIALAAASAIALCSLIFLVVWANQPEFALLYSNMAPGDAAKIVDNLKGSNIPYKLKDGGATILVPSNEIYELRIKYAGQNLISSGEVGYELFDKNNFGLTDFMQKVNLKRALEGELSKTVNQLEAVLQTRVHLVIPERSLFKEQENPSTASVILKVRPKSSLNRRQILGITRLVAGSVEGLMPENVTILDTHGNILTEMTSGDTDLGLSTSQFELTQKVENYLSRNAQSMLDQVLGKGNSIVKVAAELNFTKIRRTSEKYDPDNIAILSEEKNEESSTRSDSTLFQRENTISNYEINKTIEEFEDSPGEIERLSIAVFLNTPTQEDGQVIPRQEGEVKKMAEIVKHAVGFNAERKDRIVVQQISFDRSFINQETEALESIENKELIIEMTKLALVVLGSVGLLLMLRGLYKKSGGLEHLRNQTTLLLSASDNSPEHLLPEGENEDLYAKKLSADAKAKLKEQNLIAEEVKEFTSKEPEQATELLRYWLLEDENEESGMLDG